ncbi:hypothetical protein [Permianibacter aggregans]|uniref:Uncharacterized protein n=1 Tax=Permianibacter aggregans TaxID=1510150 RepID=A0A4R6U9F9_9GAMM|nr:hypothetical protein [Permianibacter aggregans]QGX39696.1 hypothetical protein E2H98_08520 [Permianibacter aggregans]TDQ43228.1 hypothetical protein EV696_13126 [Permianibacter aggregans]
MKQMIQGVNSESRSMDSLSEVTFTTISDGASLKIKNLLILCSMALITGIYLVWVWEVKSLISSLNDKIAKNDHEADFSQIVTKDWELVCSLHPYSGPLYLKQYDRVYEPQGYPDDGTWELLFIDVDGESFSITGSRHDGFGIQEQGCLKRADAKFTYDGFRKVWRPAVPGVG